MARSVMVGAREYQAGGYSRSGRENGVGSLCRYADAVGLTESGERPVAGKWWRSVVPDRDDPPPVVDTSVAHPAGVYDYWRGGKDNFAADREVGEQTLRAYPALALAARGKGVPRPGRALPGRRGGRPPVPRHRYRPADREQHARGRPGRRARIADRLRGQRPDRARPPSRPADQHPGGHDPLSLP